MCMCISCRQRCRSQNLSRGFKSGKTWVKSYPITMRCRSHIDPMCWRKIEGNLLESILDCKKKRFCPLQGILHDLETDWPVLSGDGPSVQVRREVTEIFVGELGKTFRKAASPGKHSKKVTMRLFVQASVYGNALLVIDLGWDGSTHSR